MAAETELNVEEPEWTAFELQLRSFRKSQCKESFLRDKIWHSMQESYLRGFLYHLNSAQLEEERVQRDQIDRLRFDIGSGLQGESAGDRPRRDDPCLCDCLAERPIGGDPRAATALRSADGLRLTGAQVEKMDDSLKWLEKLRCLILAGCCVEDFPGEYLPRGLMMLEMYCNRLHRLDLFASSCPTNLVYLGLGRNYLTQDVLWPLSKMEFLLHLDLSDNDIECLASLVSICSQLKNLTSLELRGNPCSYAMNYPYTIVMSLPKLFFLDGEVLKKSSCSEEEESGGNPSDLGTLRISLIRMMSFPQPKNEKIQKKKVAHTFRAEVLCPLLNKYVPNNQESFEQLKTEPIDKNKQVIDDKNKRGSRQSSQGRKKRKSSKSRDKKSSKAEKGRKKKNSGVSQESKKISMTKDKTKEDEHIFWEDEFDENLCFLSERKKWNKIMEFSEPTIEIPQCDLTLLRNVFRSSMVVYITHLKTLPPIKGKNKTKNKSKKSIDIENNQENKDNKEILVRKTVVAKLKIPLHSILWTENSLDYLWSKLYPTRVVEEFSPLKDLRYVIKKKKTPKISKKGNEEQSSELPIPKESTVHIGVGVKRTSFQDL